MVKNSNMVIQKNGKTKAKATPVQAKKPNMVKNAKTKAKANHGNRCEPTTHGTVGVDGYGTMGTICNRWEVLKMGSFYSSNSAELDYFSIFRPTPRTSRFSQPSAFPM